jgi:hypothetical protein
MRSRRFGKKIAIIAVVMGVMLVAGVAFAAWTASGSGSGQASSRTAQTVTVTAATGAADLYPGANGAVYFTLTNTNPYSITFDTATVGTITSSNPAACPSANVVTGPGPFTGLSLQVAANATSGTLSIPNAVSMLHSATDGCQNKTFTVSLTLSGSQD